jgi:hypothetical protein
MQQQQLPQTRLGVSGFTKVCCSYGHQLASLLRDQHFKYKWQPGQPLHLI